MQIKLLLIPLVAVVAIWVNLVHMKKYTYSSPPAHSALTTTNCNSILKAGKYIQDTSSKPTGWQPDGCVLKNYKSFENDNLGACLRPGDQILVIGDSTARHVYWGFANILRGLRDEIFAPHKAISGTVNGVTVNFIWDEYLNSTGFNQILDVSLKGLNSPLRQPALEHNKDPGYIPKLYLFITFGAWYVNQNVKGYDFRLKTVVDILDRRADNAFEAVYIAPPLVPMFSALDFTHAKHMTRDIFGEMVKQTDDIFNYDLASQRGGVRYRQMDERKNQISAYYVPVFNHLSGENHGGLRDNGGIHLLEPGFRTEAGILLNHMCNNKISQSQSTPIDGTTCCIDYTPTKETSTVKSIVLALLAAGLLAFTNPSKCAAIAFLLIGIVAGYSYLTNQTQVVSKIGFEYSFTEIFGMMEIWTLIILISTGLDKPRSNCGIERLFMREWQGICVSLFLIIRYSGLSRVEETFTGVIMERILFSTWIMIDIYSFTVDYLESANEYKKSFGLWIHHVARVAVLPLLMGAHGISKSSQDTNQDTFTFVDIPARLIYWYTFLYLTGPLISLTSAWKSRFSSQVAILLLVILAGIPQVISLIWTQLFALQYTTPHFVSAISSDYWLCVIAILAAQARPFIPAAPKKIPIGAIAGATISLVTICNIVVLDGRLNLPDNNSGEGFPLPFSPNRSHEYENVLSTRGDEYTPFVHAFIVVCAGACYIVLRAAILERTGHRFSLWARAMTPFSYEMLVLHPYMFLAACGSVRLEYLPTGGAPSSLMMRTMGIVPPDWQFPYFWWKLAGKFQKCVALGITCGMLWIGAEWSSSVWRKDHLDQQLSEEKFGAEADENV